MKEKGRERSISLGASKLLYSEQHRIKYLKFTTICERRFSHTVIGPITSISHTYTNMANNSTPPCSKSETVIKFKWLKYKADCVTEFERVAKSCTGDAYVFRTFCRCDFCVAHGSHDDIKKHVGTKKHVIDATAAATQLSMFQFVQMAVT